MNHFNIEARDDLGADRLYFLHEKYFRSVKELINYYQTTDIPNREKVNHIRLLYPVHSTRSEDRVPDLRSSRQPQMQAAAQSNRAQTLPRQLPRQNTLPEPSSNGVGRKGPPLRHTHSIATSQPAVAQRPPVLPDRRPSNCSVTDQRRPSLQRRPSNPDPLLPLPPVKPKSHNPLRKLFGKKRTDSETSIDEQAPQERILEQSDPMRDRPPMPLPAHVTECPYAAATPSSLDEGYNESLTYDQPRDVNTDLTPVCITFTKKKKKSH